MQKPSFRLRAGAFLAGMTLLAFSGWASADPPSHTSATQAGKSDWEPAALNRPLGAGDPGDLRQLGGAGRGGHRTDIGVHSVAAGVPFGGATRTGRAKDDSDGASPPNSRQPGEREHQRNRPRHSEEDLRK